MAVTNQEIARYWKQREILEEDHLNAAVKAAARVRARNLSDDDYLQFENSLKEEDDESKENEKCSYENRERIGIKNWWRESKYAYLNQPAMMFARSQTTILHSCCS